MESTKLLIVILIVALIILIAGAAVGFGWGGRVWYTQVDNDCVHKVAASDELVYEYSLLCYDRDGSSRELSFKTARVLREDAWLMLNAQPIRGVTAWQEVLPEEIPDPAAEKLGAA